MDAKLGKPFDEDVPNDADFFFTILKSVGWLGICVDCDALKSEISILSLFDVVEARDNDDVIDGPGNPIESSTLSSIGDDIDWNELIRQLFDAIDSSPSVIEPNAESCDGLQLLLLLHVFVPRIEYSMRRLFEFFDVVHRSVVNWLGNVDIAATGDVEGMVKLSYSSFRSFKPPPALPSFEALGELLDAMPKFDVDGIDSLEWWAAAAIS